METIGPNFEALLTYVWRRHLVAAVARVESLDGCRGRAGGRGDRGVRRPGQLQRPDQPARPSDEIGDLVEVFEGRSHDVVSLHRGRVVKTLGDSVLFIAASPADGIEIAWDIVKVIGGDQRLPDVRVGRGDRRGRAADG